MDRNPLQISCFEVETVSGYFVLVKGEVAEELEVKIPHLLMSLKVVAWVLELEDGFDVIMPVKIVEVL